ncbi:5610_t:CDS:2 [Scutellospora calospora]|uniref:5610_t:CDS:1 n=1 Tax=Scutellospora calospora TaxID=85575 RepID=A0ACA9KIR3_9GLOM|nr:5610_t:CDS:2 [Scutellospora calospora]
MSRHHLGGSERHRFTNDIIVLGTKPTNKYNTYCVCKACDEILGQEETLKNPITNKKNIVRNHLKNCKHFRAKKGSEEAVKIYLDDMNDETPSISSTPSTPKKQRKKPLNSNTMSNFIVKDTTNQATQEFFEFLNPALTLPARHALSNRILDAERNNFIKSREQKLREDVVRKNILKQNIFGSLFILSTGEVQVWEAIDISSEREQMIDVIPKIKKMTNDALNIGTKLLAIVSDSAPAYSAARHRLRLQYPEIIFIPCFAHQYNLAMGEIFKESDEFKTAMKQAIQIVGYFNNRIHSYFIGKLRDLQKQTYSKYIALICPGNTPTTFESPLTYNSNNEESNSSDELYLPQNITSILLNDNF